MSKPSTAALDRVAAAARARAEADVAYRDAIRAASAAGHSTRAIGNAAGVSHVRIVQMLK